MTEQAINDVTGQQLSDLCKNLIPAHNAATLLSKLQDLFGDRPVRLARISDDWYRIGGVVDSNGKRIAHDLTEWVERTFIECGQNFQTLIEHASEQHFIATKQTGNTLYFVIETGKNADDFILLEIDKTNEMSDRLLINEDVLPEDLEDIIDPFTPALIESFNVGHARYQYRRKTDIKSFMETLNKHHIEKHPVQRFMDDWNHSTASDSTLFCQDWIIRPFHHTGRYGEQIINAEIINLRTKQLQHLEDLAGKQGNSLHSLLTRFDKQAGYPFAWFFYMVKGKLVSPHNGEAVYHDITGDFAYLPQRDEAVLKSWIATPYNV